MSIFSNRVVQCADKTNFSVNITYPNGYKSAFTMPETNICIWLLIQIVHLLLLAMIQIQRVVVMLLKIITTIFLILVGLMMNIVQICLFLQLIIS
jgi:hypothetical protein